MDKKNIIIIALIVLIVAAVGAFALFSMNNYEKKTVEIFENGTTMVVPAGLELTNKSEMSVNFDDEDDYNTHILAFRFDDEENFLDINSIGENIVDSFIKEITDNAELQDNGVFKLPFKERKKLAAQFGTNVKGNNSGADIYIGVLKNDTLNQTIIIISENEQYVEDMMDSIEWKAPSKAVVNDTDAVNATKPVQSADTDDEEDDNASADTDESVDDSTTDYDNDGVDDTYVEEDDAYLDEEKSNENEKSVDYY